MGEYPAFKGHTGWVLSAAFSADGKRIVSGSRDKSLMVWDPVEGACLQTLRSHTRGPRSVHALPGGRVLSACQGSHSAQIRVWNATSGRCLQTLSSRDGVLSGVAVLPDGCVLAATFDPLMEANARWRNIRRILEIDSGITIWAPAGDRLS